MNGDLERGLTLDQLRLRLAGLILKRRSGSREASYSSLS
jgi:hypothetical protein